MIAGFAAAYMGVIWFADPFWLLLASISLLWLAVPLVTVTLIILLYRTRAGLSERPALNALALYAAIGLLLGIARPVNHYAQDRAVIAAKDYPARVAPLLEAYRQLRGTYPANLDQLPSHPRVPRLLRTTYGYRTDGLHYRFTFSKPGGLIDVWDYDSNTHTWHFSS